MIRVLFVCSRNRLRSPTAEQVFAGMPGVETASAGLAPDAEQALDADLLAWATLVLVMEKTHLRRLKQRFARQLQGKRVACLDIPDNYAFMQEELVALLHARVRRFLRY